MVRVHEPCVDFLSQFSHRIESYGTCTRIADKRCAGSGDARDTNVRGARSNARHTDRSAANARGWDTRRKHKTECAAGSEGKKTRKTAKSDKHHEGEEDADAEESSADDKQ
jgi:hypothetical protein